MGEMWLEDTLLPLPLGLDVVRKDLGRELASEIARGIAAGQFDVAPEVLKDPDLPAAALVAIDPRDRRFAQPIVNPLTHDRPRLYVHRSVAASQRQPEAAVSPCGDPTGFDSGEPRWRR